MGLVEGTFTVDRRVPSASSYSFSHAQNVGSDRHLVVIIASPSVAVNSVTYGGVSMTEVREDNTPYSTYWSVWELANPATGSNTLAVTLASANYNGVSTVCYSFTGCMGVGNTALNNIQTIGQTVNITISGNSMVIAGAISGNQTSAYIEIPDGTGRTLDWNHNINNFTFGGISPSLTAGTKTIQGGSSASNIMLAIEVKEKVSVSPTQGSMFLAM